ncbi:MAG: WYL domain-containing protein [Actinobacteria bacterium]|nr:WYL domain-containing protein [Actinomycetota bacterium]
MSEGRLSRRLARILSLLPYAIQNPGVTLDELAGRFDISKKELRADLDLVFMCGLPGYTPADLIEVDYEGDHVYIRAGDYFGTPLNLTPVEGLTLYAGASALTNLPELSQADALARALAKLGRALGISNEGSAIQVSVDSGSSEHLQLLQDAIADEKRVAIEYMSASRGELTERDVDPWSLIAALGHWYVVGLDHSSGEERMFRTDRMKSVVKLDEPAPLPTDFDPEKYRGAFIGSETGRRVVFEIAPPVADWFMDYYPVVSSQPAPGGWTRVELAIGGARWAATLLMKLGDQVRQVEPEEMRNAARELAQEIVERHREAAGTS